MARSINKLNIRQLRLVVAVAEHGSLMKAAHALGISQPALTKVLREVEEILNVRIFDRLPGGARPNEQGRLALARIYRILAELNRLEEDLTESAATLSGTFRIGALPTSAIALVPACVTRLRRAYPDIGIRVRQGRTREILPELASGEIDIIVGRLYDFAVADVFLRQTLYVEPLALVARSSHPLLTEKRFDPSALVGYPVVLPAPGEPLGQEADAALAALGVGPLTIAVRSSDMSLIRELLFNSDTVAMVPRMLFGGDLTRGLIDVLPVEITGPVRRGGYICLRDRVRAPAIRALTASIRDTVLDMRARGFVA